MCWIRGHMGGTYKIRLSDSAKKEEDKIMWIKAATPSIFIGSLSFNVIIPRAWKEFTFLAVV